MGCTVVWFLATAGRPPFGGPRPPLSPASWPEWQSAIDPEQFWSTPILRAAVLVPTLGAALRRTPDHLYHEVPARTSSLPSILGCSGQQSQQRLSWFPLWQWPFEEPPTTFITRSLVRTSVCHRSWALPVDAILATSCLVLTLAASSLPKRASPVGAAPGRSRPAATVQRFDHHVAIQARLRHPKDHHRQEHPPRSILALLSLPLKKWTEGYCEWYEWSCSRGKGNGCWRWRREGMVLVCPVGKDIHVRPQCVGCSFGLSVVTSVVA